MKEVYYARFDRVYKWSSLAVRNNNVINYSLADKRAGTRFQNAFLVVHVLLLLHVDDLFLFQFLHRVRSAPVELQAHQVDPAEAAHADRGHSLEVRKLHAEQFRVKYF